MNVTATSREVIEKLRIRLASSQAVFAIAVLGLFSGLVSGGLIVMFRWLIDASQAAFMPNGIVERFEDLSLGWRFALPIAGAVVIGSIYQLIGHATRQVGIVHVLERLNYHEGHLPLKNLLVQFGGGAIALICGHSVGREGPSVHLGSAASSLMGQSLKLPNNSIRTLVACGTAAAIAASFNTPLAGVILAMEVVMMEYTIIGFTPVITAAVAATVLTHMVFGTEPVFFVPQTVLASDWDLPYILVMGVCIGALSAFFVAAVRSSARRLNRLPVGVSITLAGVFVAVIGIQVPEVMGMGYDTVNVIVSGETAVAALALILIAKLLATAVCIGARIPGGLIGPSVVMGAMVGGLFAHGAGFIPAVTSGHELFVMLGMGAMMGATLHAPLAALVALLEFTANPYLILPAMLAIISANLTARELFKQESVFSMLMRDAGLDYRDDPLSQSLRRIGVAAVMNRSFVETGPDITQADARDLLRSTPHWIIVRQEDESRSLLPASDLARFLADHDPDAVQLMEIPAQRLQLAAIHLQATMQQARVALGEVGAEALYVRRLIAPLTYRTDGILLQQDIEASYKLGG